MSNLKKMFKDCFIGTSFWLVVTILMLWFVMWAMPGFYEAFFTGALADYPKLNEDFIYGLMSIFCIPNLFYLISKDLYQFIKLCLDLNKKLIIEEIIQFDACTGAIKLDNLSKKEQKSYVNYRGYTQENKKIIISAFPDVFSYKGNMENKKYLVRYFKYSKVAIEIKKVDKTA